MKIKLQHTISFKENEETIKADNKDKTVICDRFLFWKLEDALLALQANICNGDLSPNEISNTIFDCHKLLIESIKEPIKD